jgi:hypothetical protein
MKTLVKDKLDKTKDMATEKKVMQKEVKRTGSGKAGWKWVAFFALLGTLFLAIQLIPMRKGSCFLFCDGNENGHEKDDSRSSQSHGEAAAQVKATEEKLAQVKDAEAAAQVKAAEEKLAQVKEAEA